MPRRLAAPDVVNLAGFAASNQRDGLVTRIAALPVEPPDADH